MAWYFNFCAAALPNDPTINANRMFQSACLMVFLVIYMCLDFYYRMYGPDPLEDQEVNSSSNGSEEEEEQSSEDNDKGSDETSSENDEKSISIAGGYGADENSSYVTFTTNKKGNGSKDYLKSKKNKKNKIQIQVIENVTAQEVQSFFPIVYGHFAIGGALTITHAPYAQQSIAMILYIILAMVLGFLNSKRFTISTRVVWGVMCFLTGFLVMSGLLEVGQGNFNKLKQECFAINYEPLY